MKKHPLGNKVNKCPKSCFRWIPRATIATIPYEYSTICKRKVYNSIRYNVSDHELTLPKHLGKKDCIQFPHHGKRLGIFLPKTAFFALKTLFLGQFSTDFLITAKGGYPPLTASGQKVNGKNHGKGGYPPPSRQAAGQKVNGK